MSGSGFLDDAARVAQWIATYRERLPDLPVLPRLSPGDVAASLPPRPSEEPETLDAILSDLDDVILPGLTHWNHPGFLAYFCSSTTDAGVLAEFLAAELNQNAMLWRTSPAGTELEVRMVEWIRVFVDLPDTFEGVIQDTASSSSFAALIAARYRAVPDVSRHGLAGRDHLGGCVVYMSDHAHSSLDKATVAAGLGLDNLRRIPVDERFRMIPDELERAITDDRAAGRTPVMVCATIGTTSTTSVDPVSAIADVCERLGVWMHVDAAYAGPAASLPEKRSEFEGWERADSIVLNPHKWMSTPIDCSIFLYRDAGEMRRSLAVKPEYLRSSEGGTDLMDIGLPLGRRFRALKLWFLFRTEGTAGLRGRLREHIALADRLAVWLEEDPRFELRAPHPFSLICFRALPPDGSDADEWNRRLLETVNRRGPVFLSHSVRGERYVLRLAIGSARGTEEAVRVAYRLLVEEHDRLAEG